MWAGRGEEGRAVPRFADTVCGQGKKTEKRAGGGGGRDRKGAQCLGGETDEGRGRGGTGGRDEGVAGKEKTLVGGGE